MDLDACSLGELSRSEQDGRDREGGERAVRFGSRKPAKPLEPQEGDRDDHADHDTEQRLERDQSGVRLVMT